MIKKQNLFFTLLCTLLILPGCFWSERKHPSAHPRIKQVRSKGKEGLHLSAHWLDEAACKKLFLGVNLIQEDIEILHLKLTNNGEANYTFRPSYCLLERFSVEEIAPLIQYDTSSRVCWLSLPALIFFWPLIPIVIVPQGLYWSHENHKIRRWLHKITLGPVDAFELEPYETIEKYLFVPAHAAEEQTFVFELFDTCSKELVSHSISYL